MPIPAAFRFRHLAKRLTPGHTADADHPTAPTVTASNDSLAIPGRLRLALLFVWMYHGGLLLFRSYEGTYDAYVHIFLADHYARDWFSTWDQRWYTGFTTVSYPPGTHMATGALSKLTGDLELSFAILQICSLSLLAIGVYRFSTIWVHRQAAANAALLLVFSSAIAETVHVFGQLPTTWALAFLLNAIPYLRRWAFEGRLVDLVTGTAVLAACTAGHHVTTLFGSIFFLGPVVAHGLLEESRDTAADRSARGSVSLSIRTVIPLIARRLQRVLPSLVRVAILGGAILSALVLVVLPYWWWSATDPITQVPIPHGSRDSFIENRNIGLIFFVIPWGLMLIVLPYALVRATLDRKWPLAASILLLAVLGTGGTTPVPKLLLGGAFDVLTLDRFTFWASILILPMAGLFVHSLEKGSLAAWFTATGGARLSRLAQVGFVLGMVSMSLFSATLTQHRKFQPERINVDPIVAFIEKDQHERWRFLTLGFGDQMAWLSANTTATQVDGNYHSVRRLPELISTSVERLEGAKYRGISGLGSLQQFLGVPEKYNLKYVFSNDEFYDPLLHFTGWQRLGPLENGVVVWERADIPPLPAELPVREVPGWQRIMWGTIPPLSIVAALHLLLWSALGRPGLNQEFDRDRSRRRLLFGPLGRIDRLLTRLQGRVLDATESSVEGRRSPAGQSLRAVRKRLSRPVSGRRRVARLVAVLVLLGLLPLRAAFAVSVPPEPEDVVEAYYDHLDFRHWGLAYDSLDPITRPGWELWRLQVSVRGGMLASYTKLDHLDVQIVERPSADRVIVKAELRYLSALDWYRVERFHTLFRRDGNWYIEPDATELTVPPDQLVRRNEVDYVIQGRRRVTSGNTELADIQDRPELFIRSVDLLDVDGQPVIVGEVVNVDVDPGDITLTGVLRNSDGEIIARYNATEEVLHSIRPRESTPFLIRFEEVAAGRDMDFDPLDYSPLQLDDEVASAEVYAKAVVTTGGLYRGLGVNHAELVTNGDGSLRLQGELRNDGVNEAVIPRLLISFLDDDGRVIWVQNAYLEYSIRSQRTGGFSVELDDLTASTSSEIPLKQFHNGIAPPGGELNETPALIDAPAGSPFTSLRIDLSTFVSD